VLWFARVFQAEPHLVAPLTAAFTGAALGAHLTADEAVVQRDGLPAAD